MNEKSKKNPTKKNWVTAVTFMILLIIFTVINVKMIAPFIFSILMGGILAILFFPYYQRLRAKKITPGWSSMIIIVCIVLMLVVPLTYLLFSTIKQATTIANELSHNDNLTLDNLSDQISNFKFIKPFIDDDFDMKIHIKEAIQKTTEMSLKFILSTVGSIPDRLLQLVITLISCFYFLIDGRKFMIFFNDKIPLDGDVRIKLFGALKNTAISTIWATIAAASVQSFVMFFAFLFLGVPGSFLAGTATFILSWFPFIGSAPVWIAGVIYLYTREANISIIIMIFLGIFTGLIDNYIRPLILRGRTSIHPLVSLISIFGGIGMFGLLGVFFGPVFAATLISLLQIWPTVGRRFGLTFDPPIEQLLNRRKTDN